MSFYNLIPTCPGCNQKKHENLLPLNPYSREVDFDKDLNFKLVINKKGSLDSIDKIGLRLFSSDPRVKYQVEKLDLELIYNSHKDIVSDILKKKRMLNQSRKNELYKTFNRLFKNRNEFDRVLYGNYLQKNELHKRILSKLYRDLILK